MSSCLHHRPKAKILASLSKHTVEVATLGMDTLSAATSIASAYVHVTAWGMTRTDLITCTVKSNALSPPLSISMNTTANLSVLSTDGTWR